MNSSKKDHGGFNGVNTQLLNTIYNSMQISQKWQKQHFL
jgi:hypothetical protein